MAWRWRKTAPRVVDRAVDPADDVELNQWTRAAHKVAAPYCTSPQSLVLGKEITLAPGASAVLKAEQIEVQFVRVVEDTRCPRDTTCVWAGEVKVELAIRRASQELERHEIAERGEVVVDGYRVIVLEVQPAPESTRRIAPAEYRAKLKVVCN